jgi:lactam utilization protein B
VTDRVDAVSATARRVGPEPAFVRPHGALYSTLAADEDLPATELV